MNPIVLCHLDGLNCLPALNLIFAEPGDRIGQVLSSWRVATRHGRFLRQTLDSCRRLGVAQAQWFGFDLTSIPAASWFFFRPRLATLGRMERVNAPDDRRISASRRLGTWRPCGVPVSRCSAHDTTRV